MPPVLQLCYVEICTLLLLVGVSPMFPQPCVPSLLGLGLGGRVREHREQICLKLKLSFYAHAAKTED